MSGILDALNKGLRLLKHGDDDFFDRMSSRYTVALLIVFAVIVSTGQFAGDPIDCFTPAEFNGQWVRYTDRLCWVQNTYYVPFDQSLPGPNEVKYYDREISYYQWTPLILVMQAFLYAFPSVCWSFATHHAGYGVNRAVHMCNSPENINPENRDRLIKFLSNQMDRLLGYRREYREGWVASARRKIAKKANLRFGKRYGCHLVLIYLIVKLCFIGNAIGQIYLMNEIIGDGYTAYGWRVLKMAIDGEEWDESPFFPRVTNCFFKIRRLGENQHDYVVQCVLPINLFNEKIYLFLWWWTCLVALMSTIGLFTYIPIFFSFSNKRYISKYLKIMGRNNPQEKEYRKVFVQQYLRPDGVLVLWLISKNVTDLTIGEIVTAMYDNFVAYRSKLFRPNSPIVANKTAPKSISLLDDAESGNDPARNPL
ncbi:innexin unc-9-like [Watersipora subatra]|uniref:innexin unc-9-like n=1 Tax=Watersipora subatra TaxID=2589382 RepID=UPI00355B6D00